MITAFARFVKEVSNVKKDCSPNAIIRLGICWLLFQHQIPKLKLNASQFKSENERIFTSCLITCNLLITVAVPMFCLTQARWSLNVLQQFTKGMSYDFSIQLLNGRCHSHSCVIVVLPIAWD